MNKQLHSNVKVLHTCTYQYTYHSYYDMQLNIEQVHSKNFALSMWTSIHFETAQQLYNIT